MTPIDEACEATLLFPEAPDYNLPLLLSDIAIVLNEAGEDRLAMEAIDPNHTLIRTTRLKVLIARSTAPLPLDGLLAADRPDIAALSQSEILKQLLQVSATTTVLVLPNPDPETSLSGQDARLLRAVCWDILSCLHGTVPSNLLFWGDSDTLYSAEEFEQACTYAACQGPQDTLAPHESFIPVVAQKTGVPEHFQRAPEVSPPMSDWLESTDRPSDSLDEEDEADLPAEGNRWFRRLWSRSVFTPGATRLGPRQGPTGCAPTPMVN